MWFTSAEGTMNQTFWAYKAPYLGFNPFALHGDEFQ